MGEAPLLEPAAPARIRPTHWISTLIVVAAVIGLIVWQRDQLSGLPALLAGADWRWVAVAVFAQLVSLGALAREQRRLLAVGGDRIALSSMLATTYAQTAIAMSLPVIGVPAATVFTFRRFTGFGIERAVAAWALAVSTVYSGITFAAITALGALISGSGAGAVTGVVTLVVLLPVTVVLFSLHRPALRNRVATPLTAVLALSKRVTRRPHGDPVEITADAVGQLALLRLSGRDTVLAGGAAVINWLAEIGCLVCAILAVDGGVPWQSVILVWAAGAGISSLNLTPGGIGVVEATVSAALVAAGLDAGTAVAAVLVYRAIKLWLVLVIGAITLLVLRRKPAASSADVPVESPIIQTP